MGREREIWTRVEDVLTQAKVIAVVGAHLREHKPAFYVPDYMHAQGYTILPVNPAFVGASRWGEPFRSTLAELGRPVDVVNLFRRSAAVPEHVDDILTLTPAPRWVWMQLGVRSAEAAQRLEDAGIEVIQDRCLLADHQSWSGR
jgi:predicted CoA-binding protein